MDNGWIKLHRKILKNPVVMKDPDHLAVWIYLLLTAAHEDYQTLYGGKKITLKPGQLITGRKKISAATSVQESKVKRILKLFENDHQIDRQTNSYGTLISICSWNEYQQTDQRSDQRVTNEWPTSDQRVTTKQEHKNIRIKEDIDNIKDIIRNPDGSHSDIQRVVDAWNELPVTHITRVGSGTRRHRMLKARLGEYGVDAVIEAINLVSQSPFLLGRVSDFTVTFDWFIKPNNFIKVYEGNYSNRDTGKRDAIQDFIGGESYDESRVW